MFNKISEVKCLCYLDKGVNSWRRTIGSHTQPEVISADTYRQLGAPRAANKRVQSRECHSDTRVIVYEAFQLLGLILRYVSLVGPQLTFMYLLWSHWIYFVCLHRLGWYSLWRPHVARHTMAVTTCTASFSGRIVDVEQAHPTYARLKVLMLKSDYIRHVPFLYAHVSMADSYSPATRMPRECRDFVYLCVNPDCKA